MGIPFEYIYPIGKMPQPLNFSQEDVRLNILRIAQLPEKLSSLTQTLSDDALSLTYRPDGWNIRQIVHHIADSHINCYLRCKFAMEQENPTIMPYDENVWADFFDGAQLPVDSSLKLISGLHFRWVAFLTALGENDFTRTFFHPGNQKKTTLAEVTSMYAWHGDHHYEQIKGILQRNSIC